MLRICISLTVAYELVGQNQKALESYAKAGMWRECLNIAYSISMPLPEVAKVAHKLAASLVDNGQYVDAARLYVDYGNDRSAIESAVNALVKGYLFHEAIRVVASIHICI